MKALIVVLAAGIYFWPAGAAGRELEQRETSRSEASAPAAEADLTWEGTFLFQEGGGRGSFVEHTIKVYRQGSDLIADLDAAGFQTAVSLRCDAKVEGAKLNLYFRSYREENVGEPYRKGQLLLTLEKAGSGRRSRLLTDWGAYRPVFRRPKGAGVYFKKTRVAGPE
jgi:uncharacterized protein DUF5991